MLKGGGVSLVMQPLRAHHVAHEAEEYPAMSQSTTDIRIVPLPEGQDVLTDILRDGARRMLAQAVEAEVAAYVAAHDHLVDEAGRRQVVRNGHLPETEVPAGKVENIYSDKRLTPNATPRFWLHLDQPQCLRLQRIRLRHLVESCLVRVRSHHTRVPAACPQMSYQRPKTLHRQSAGRRVRLLLELGRLRGLRRGHRVSARTVLGQSLVLEQQR